MAAVLPNDNQQNSEETKIACHYCKSPGHVIRDCRERLKKEQYQKMIVRPETRNLRHLNHLHPVLIANKQIILQKNVGAVAMRVINQKGSNKFIQQTTDMMGKKKEFRLIQNLYQFSETL